MAKILDKLFPSNNQKLIKLRQKYNWVKTELDNLEESFNSIKEKKQNKLLYSLNKKLEKSAFCACDKQEYSDCVAAEKLKKFDVKAYMSQRRVNHGAAKGIFKAIKANGDTAVVLQKQQMQLEKLKIKREKFILKLESEKTAFLEKNANSNSEQYEILKAESEKTYLDTENKLIQEFDGKIAQRKQVLTKKLEILEGKINALKAEIPSHLTLDDGVLLTVKNLKMYFGGLKAVDDLTFDVKKGEIFGLIGPNGAGKTTVFNCITRFYNATGGETYFENKDGEVVDLRTFKVHDIILQGISRTFQNVELVKEISVIENLLVACTRNFSSNMAMHALGLPSIKKEERLLKAKAMRILKFMGIESYAAWYAMGLPYGILKKVEIARALMSDPKLIIMDEPAAGLNDTETAELTQTIRKIRDEFGTTILLVEHDMGLVMNVCDTVCAIAFGKMLAIGTTEEIQNNKAVQEAYLGVEEDE